MKTGFTSGVIIGGIVGAAVSMMVNGDINMKRTKRRIMRMGRDVFRKSRRLVADIGNLMQ
ncbi:hypothetical protein Cst_c14040 [Thermoclostridium stercorarium subsp. stercorarium DSM 8532]|jgi:gas vesicle protein|uniref:YtxH domain-containing protein n=3 Tax=Thermoclostridium stercorarium TaxID=1510 RepID=L7VJU6_THES1|nr:hypothetical protein [Thermoclostridium stercorarium]AGC68395.1 hypothetical protein Cst_c14040 [Thermoclostridium stercorarium subsp. stercorarium DSM 8532]AGI39415.1 hypothetical protein Clst_1354 [Thermoclostridium stercorarium subsp. stercorarium DSM 8532]ANW98755.1 hypothetical protein CSTERTH_06800 [Thermoclostridium stercorarium subsp. thermolacticum DSM 2910]ANX01272.1 hypothetical protein CSTERLE_06660 [Thermoclostridium stercorarium subsp. leptospartum DSM 9219]UZQ86898.1 hypothet